MYVEAEEAKPLMEAQVFDGQASKSKAWMTSALALAVCAAGGVAVYSFQSLKSEEQHPTDLVVEEAEEGGSYSSKEWNKWEEWCDTAKCSDTLRGVSCEKPGTETTRKVQGLRPGCTQYNSMLNGNSNYCLWPGTTRTTCKSHQYSSVLTYSLYHKQPTPCMDGKYTWWRWSCKDCRNQEQDWRNMKTSQDTNPNSEYKYVADNFCNVQTWVARKNSYGADYYTWSEEVKSCSAELFNDYYNAQKEIDSCQKCQTCSSTEERAKTCAKCK